MGLFLGALLASVGALGLWLTEPGAGGRGWYVAACGASAAQLWLAGRADGLREAEKGE